MKVNRIVANINTSDLALAKEFYVDILGMTERMNHGWIITYGSDEKMNVQISFAREGGSGTATPDLSIEVDHVDEAYAAMKNAGYEIVYPITDEPWGVRRFFVLDPFKKVVNILSHS